MRCLTGTSILALRQCSFEGVLLHVTVFGLYYEIYSFGAGQSEAYGRHSRAYDAPLKGILRLIHA
jgi:hypothetical protein